MGYQGQRPWLVRSLLARLGLRHTDHVSVARDFSVYSAVNVVSLVLLLGTALFLRRFLGKELAGIWITLELLPNYAQYAPLGVLNSAERDLPYLLGAGRVEEFDTRKQTLFWLSNAIGAALTLAVVVGTVIFRSRISSSALFVGLLSYAPLLWMQILAAYFVVLYRARKRFVVLSTRQGMANLGKAALTLWGGWSFGLNGVFAALLVAGGAQLVLFRSGLEEKFERVFDRRILGPMIAAGFPMLLGAVAFETIRNADRIVIPYALSLGAAGGYSVVPLVCQGVFYFPNTLALVMYPRFQERYGETQTIGSLQKFLEIPLLVLSDALLAAIVILLVVMPPALQAFLPAYTESIEPMRIMLVGTYFLCLSPPAGQFLLTIHKQVEVLYIAVPSMCLALAAAYLGSSHGLPGVALGVALAGVVYFVAVNVYAFAQLGSVARAARPVLRILFQATLIFLLVWMIERYVPAGPSPFDRIGGWQGLVALGVAAPLIKSAVGRLRRLSGVDRGLAESAVLVDKRSPDH